MRRTALLITLLITLLMAPWIGYTARLPGTGEDDESLREFLGKTVEGDIENSRTKNPQRKASEDKKPWQGDSLQDMEETVWPSHDMTPFNWDLAYGDIPLAYRGVKRTPGGRIIFFPFPSTLDEVSEPTEPGAGWYVFGCLLFGPDKIDCTKGPFTVMISTSQIVSFIDVRGHIYKWVQNGSSIKIWPSEAALNNSKITISVTTRPLVWQEKGGVCTKTILVECGQVCSCNVNPSIDATDWIIADGGTESLWVESSGNACPPFTWYVSGAGYTLSKTKTDADGEINVLSAAVGSGCTAIVAVVDSCLRVSVNKIVLNDKGSWQIKEQHECSTPCGTETTAYKSSVERHIKGGGGGSVQYTSCADDNCQALYMANEVMWEIALGVTWQCLNGICGDGPGTYRYWTYIDPNPSLCTNYGGPNCYRVEKWECP